ncbi:hypothetical protein CW748_06015 [Alteromonadales bacterium alter-6D02]|nr:hypothetical protein CW748_06015 [Alteromonadales bacterium alter-6D02]
MCVCGLALSTPPIATAAQAEKSPAPIQVVNCLGNDTACNSDEIKRDYAFNVANAYLRQAMVAERFDLFFYSEETKQVIHYLFEVSNFKLSGNHFRSRRTFELSLLSNDAVTGDLAQAVTEQVMAFNARNEPYAGYPEGGLRGTFDLDILCGAKASIRSPELVLIQCQNALRERGLWNAITVQQQSAQVIRKHLDTQSRVEVHSLQIEQTKNVSVKRKALEVKAFALKGELKQSNTETETNYRVTKVGWGAPLFLSASDGYRYTVIPDANGALEMVQFIAPSRIDVPVDKQGNINSEKFLEGIEQGHHKISIESKEFIEIMAARTGVAKWWQLAQMIDDNFVCDYCWLKITD